MGIINSIGAYFQKVLGGFTFGTQTDRITVTGNITLEQADVTGSEYTFPPENGLIALGSGSAGNIPKFITQYRIGDSLISETGSMVTISGSAYFLGDVTASIFTGSFYGDGTNLTGVTSYTDADTLNFINSINVVSGSSQLTSSYDTRYELQGRGIVSGSSQIVNILIPLNNFSGSINAYTASNNTTNNLQDSRLTNLENATSSYESTLTFNDTPTIDLIRSTNTITAVAQGGIVSGSSQLTGSYDLRYELQGRGIISGSTQVTNITDPLYEDIASGTHTLVSGSIQINYPQISNIPIGILSSSNTTFAAYTASANPYVEQDLSTNATRYVTFVDSSTAGLQRLNLDTSLTYNPSSNTLTATTFSGTATQISVSDAGSDTTTWPLLATSQTGNQSARTDAGLTYNSSTNTLGIAGSVSASVIIKIGGTADDILLGDGTTTSLSAIVAGSGSVSGDISNTEIAYANGANSLTGSANFTWINANKRLNVTSGSVVIGDGALTDGRLNIGLSNGTGAWATLFSSTGVNNWTGVYMTSDNNFSFQSYNNQNKRTLLFAASGSSYISGSGYNKLGINTTKPTGSLHVFGQNHTGTATNWAQAVLIVEQNNGNRMYIDGNDIDVVNSSLNPDYLYLQDYTKAPVIMGGKLSVGNGVPSYNLDVSGSGRLTGGLIVTGSVNLPTPWFSEDFASGFGDFTTGGDVAWVIDSGSGNGDSFSARSGVTPDLRSSHLVLTKTTTEPITLLQFDYKTSTEDGYDYLIVFIDEVATFQATGETPWTTQNLYIYNTGSHTIKWTYLKDPNTTGGTDQVWVDNVKLMNTTPSSQFVADVGFGGTFDVFGNATFHNDTTFDGFLIANKRYAYDPTDGHRRLSVAFDSSSQIVYMAGMADQSVEQYGLWCNGTETHFNLGTTSNTERFRLQTDATYTSGYMKMPGTSAIVRFGRTHTDDSGYMLSVSGSSLFHSKVNVNKSTGSLALNVNSNSTAFTANFHQPSTNTGYYNVVTFSQAGGSALGYIGTGGSTVGDMGFQNALGVGTQNAYPMYLMTNDTHRVKVDSTKGYVQLYNKLLIGAISASTVDTDKFLVSSGSNGEVAYRTGTQVLSDIGGASNTNISSSLYATAVSTDSDFKIPFLNTTGTTSGTYPFLMDNGSTPGFTYNPNDNLLKLAAVQIDEAGTTPSKGNALTYNFTDVFSNTGNDGIPRNLVHYGFGIHKPIGASTSGGRGAYVSGYFGIDLFTTGVSRLHISQTGDVGIRALNPSASLHVQKDNTSFTWTPYTDTTTIFEGSTDSITTIAAGTNGNAELWFADPASQSSGRVRYEHNTNNMEFWTNGSQMMQITDTGYVGIGKDEPTHYLHVGNATNTGVLSKFDGINSRVVFGGQAVVATGESGIWNFVNTGTNVGTRFYVQDANNVDSRLTFDFKGNAGSTNILSGTSTGKIGIGTTTPNQVLDVVGNSSISGSVITEEVVLTDTSNVAKASIVYNSTDASIDFIFV